MSEPMPVSRGSASAVNAKQINDIRRSIGLAAGWLARCSVRGMTNIPVLIERVRAEFVEMPGLELSVPQAARLWNLDMADCRAVIDVLINAGFLRWTSSQTVIRTGRDLIVMPDVFVDSLELANVSVRKR